MNLLLSQFIYLIIYSFIFDKFNVKVLSKLYLNCVLNIPKVMQVNVKVLNYFVIFIILKPKR